MSVKIMLKTMFAAILALGVSSFAMVPAAMAGDDDDEDKVSKASKTSVELVCQCGAVAEAATKASEAKDDADEAKDDEDKSKSAKDSEDDDESSSDESKSKADDDYKSAKDSKDKADKNKDKADKNKDKADESTAGSPCTCANGNPGFWGTTGGTSTGSTVPAAFREIHGE